MISLKQKKTRFQDSLENVVGKAPGTFQDFSFSFLGNNNPN